MKNKRIGLWQKPTGNLLSHGKGLTEEEIKFLQSLKIGDRLIIWDNTKRNENTNYPSHSLTLYEDNRQTIERKGKKYEKSNKSKSVLA